jgi:hypothetical protein
MKNIAELADGPSLYLRQQGLGVGFVSSFTLAISYKRLAPSCQPENSDS